VDHQSFAQLLGNYGEFVGAVAVVATLVYLTVQVKHSQQSMDANTKAIRGQVVSEVMHSGIAYLNMFVQGHDVSDIFVRFTSDESLDSKELLVSDAVMSAMFLARQHEFFQWKQGLLDENVFVSLHHVSFVVLGCRNIIRPMLQINDRVVQPASRNVDGRFIREIENKSSENRLIAFQKLDGLV
jgi:hypothetical protein